MADIRVLRRRIRSVQNTAKITKAMQMIAASKMRRAQQLTIAGRPYADKMREVLAEKYRQVPEFRDALNAAEGQITHPVSDVFWKDKLPMLLDELRTPTAKSGKPVVEYIAHMDVATLRANPEKFYLFGDNLQERGKPA